jgi:hypothetical protein
MLLTPVLVRVENGQYTRRTLADTLQTRILMAPAGTPALALAPLALVTPATLATLAPLVRRWLALQLALESAAELAIPGQAPVERMAARLLARTIQILRTGSIPASIRQPAHTPLARTPARVTEIPVQVTETLVRLTATLPLALTIQTSQTRLIPASIRRLVPTQLARTPVRVTVPQEPQVRLMEPPAKLASLVASPTALMPGLTIQKSQTN